MGALYEKSLNIELQWHRNNNKSLNPCRCSLSLSVTSVTGKYVCIVIILKLCKCYKFVLVFWMLKMSRFNSNLKKNHSQGTRLIKCRVEKWVTGSKPHPTSWSLQQFPIGTCTTAVAALNSQPKGPLHFQVVVPWV